jgi:hypothetical protein
MKRPAKILAVVVFLGYAAAPATAGGAMTQIQAYSTDNQLGNQSWGGNLGLDFNVNSPITISALGAFASGGQDFVPGIQVAIYERTNGNGPGNPDDPNNDHLGTLIRTVTIGSGDFASDNYRFSSIAPLTLQSGYYSIVTVGFNDPNLDLNENFHDGSLITTNDGGGLISFVGSGRYDANGTLDYPFFTTIEQGYNTSAHVFGGGSFLYAAAPEPASMTLLGFGIAGIVTYGWRRRNAVYLSIAQQIVL